MDPNQSGSRWLIVEDFFYLNDPQGFKDPSQLHFVIHQ